MTTRSKIGVLKLGGRITYGGLSAVGGEVISLIKMLENNFYVTAITKVLKKDLKNPCWFDVIDTEENYEKINDLGFEHLIVINGNVNFFGGGEDRSQILNYHMINHFKGKITYLLCDPYLYFKQLWNSVEGKRWGNKYKKEDIFVTRTDINCLCQPYNVAAQFDLMGKNAVPINKMDHFPFEQFPLIYKNDIDRSQLGIPTVDLMYGGTLRSGRREEKLIKFYFDYSDIIKVQLFGNIRLSQFKKLKGENVPEFVPPVDYRDFTDKMSSSLVTVCISDNWSDGKNLTQRIYECLMSSCITLIDEDFDPTHRVFPGENGKFFYVRDRKDVEARVLALKQHTGYREKILNIQKKMVNDFSIIDYMNKFCNLIQR